MAYDHISQVDVALWLPGLKVLSLERAVSLAARMGLDLTPEEMDVVRRNAREFVEKTSTVTMERVEDRPGILVDTLQNIARQSSDETAAKLMRWGYGYLRDSTGGLRPAFVWNALLGRLAGLSATNYALAPLDLAPSRKEELTGAIRPLYREMQGWLQELRRLETSPPSAWEERVLETYEAPLSPFDLVADAIQWNTFRRAFVEIRQLLTETEMGLLSEWGKEQAPRMQIPDELVEDLRGVRLDPDASRT